MKPKRLLSSSGSVSVHGRTAGGRASLESWASNAFPLSPWWKVFSRPFFSMKPVKRRKRSLWPFTSSPKSAASYSSAGSMSFGVSEILRCGMPKYRQSSRVRESLQSTVLGTPASSAAMLPWIREPNEKSNARSSSIHVAGST